MPLVANEESASPTATRSKNPANFNCEDESKKKKKKKEKKKILFGRKIKKSAVNLSCRCLLFYSLRFFISHFRFTGAPLIMTHLSKHDVVAYRGHNAALNVVVCADPRPRRAAWEWGSMLLEAGAGVGRTQAEELLGVRIIHSNANFYWYYHCKYEAIATHSGLSRRCRKESSEPLNMAGLRVTKKGMIHACLVSYVLPPTGH